MPSGNIIEMIIYLSITIFFFLGIINSLIIYKNKKTISHIFLMFLMLGGGLYSLAEFLDIISIWSASDDFINSIIVFLSSMLLILGLIVILEQKLQDSEVKFRNLYEQTPFSIILLDFKGMILDCNPATIKLLNIKKKVIINKNLFSVSIFPLEVLELLKNEMKNKDGKNIIKPLEFQLKQQNKTPIWVSLQLSYYKLYNNTCIQLILHNISQRKKIESLINKEMKKLKEIDQIRTDLIRRTSHELKTPLNSIFTTSQFLLENCKEEINENVLKFIEIINRGGNRLHDLIKNLMDIFELDSHKLILKKDNINIIKIIDDCVNDMFYLAKERDILIKMDLGNEFFIMIDKVRIEQVLLNLLSNAIKNTPPKGLIYFYTEIFRDYIDIKIKDTGIGFTKEEEEKVFKKFGKIERMDVDVEINIEGSGLGLYISSELIKLHGGKIWLESKGRNKGTLFTVRIPIY